MASCDNCRFWEMRQHIRENDVGECRKFAPRQMVEKGDGQFFGQRVWPATYDVDWCGEFETIPDDKGDGPGE